MHRLFCFLVLLALISTARGQTAYSYRYWFDNNLATQHTGEANGETILEIDISSLAKGSMHTLHLQGLDASGKWSPVRTQFFFISKDTDLETATARYWFDNDEATVQTAPTINGLIELDISHMNIGTHAVHYQTFNAAGDASPVHTAYFYMNELQRATLSCQLWIDDDEGTKNTYPLTDKDIVIEAEDLSIGMHNLHAVLLNSNGQVLAQSTTEFEVKEPTVTITLINATGTFSSDKDIDFTDSQLRAYIATGYNTQSDDVMLSRVYDVPANTGLVVKGEPGTYEVPVRESHSYYMNFMIGTQETITLPQSADGYTNYVISGGVFKLLKDNGKVNAGRAYLHVPSKPTASRELRIVFDDETATVGGITTIEPAADTYTMQGVKVNRPTTKGLYIKNGKKVYVK